jgi:hypothetical protein
MSDRSHVSQSFSTPQLTVSGLEAAKQELFTQPAPVPQRVLMPVQQMSNGVVFREIVFKIGRPGHSAKVLTIRQEWTLIYSGGMPLIGSVSASAVS